MESGMDPLGFLMDMPVMDMLYFQDVSLTTSPEEIVDGMLAQVHST